MAKRQLFDATFEFLGETALAIKVTEDGKKEIWLPKSQIEYEIQGTKVEVTLPLWLAREKELAGV